MFRWFSSKAAPRLAIAALAAFAVVDEAAASSTIIAGRSASASGTVLLAQNEDLIGRTIVDEYRTKSSQHHWNETVEYIKGAAVPQIPHTLGFHASLTRSLTKSGGYLTSKSFINDAGVVILSNHLDLQNQENPEQAVVKNGIISSPAANKAAGASKSPAAYALPSEAQAHQLLKSTKALRSDQKISEGAAFTESGAARIMAERGRTAKAAVQALVDLIFMYGYAGSYREFFVADHKEAFVVAAIPGRTAVARRIDDDEVFFACEVPSIGTVDLLDEDKVITAKWTRIRAEEMLESLKDDGKKNIGSRILFTPSDYIPAPNPSAEMKCALKSRFIASSLAPKSREQFANASSISNLKPEAPLSREVLKSLIRSRSAKAVRLTSDITSKCTVYETAEDPVFTLAEASYGKPTVLPFIPMHPLAREADWSSASEFPEPDFNFNPHKDYSLFSLHAGLFSLNEEEKPLADAFKQYEKDAAAALAAAHKDAAFLSGVVSPLKASRMLNGFDSQWRLIAKSAVEDDIRRTAPVKISILEDAISTKQRSVKLVVYGSKTFDASEIVKKSLKFGSPAASTEDGTMQYAECTGLVRRDFNDDGFVDAVAAFGLEDIQKNLAENAFGLMFIEGRVENGRSFVGYDSIELK